MQDDILEEIQENCDELEKKLWDLLNEVKVETDGSKDALMQLQKDLMEIEKWNMTV